MGPYVISALITGHTLETKISVIVSLIMEKSGNTIIIVYPERQSKGAKRKLAASGPDTDSDQTKFLRQEGGGGSSRGGAGYGKAKGRGRAEDSAQVPPGTVTRHGIADPEYLNCFLVAHKCFLGTSVPRHYHVLHLDWRLIEKGCGVDDPRHQDPEK